MGYLEIAKKFQSTLPARGSDGEYTAFIEKFKPFQSTLPARGSDIRLVARVAPA